MFLVVLLPLTCVDTIFITYACDAFTQALYIWYGYGSLVFFIVLVVAIAVAVIPGVVGLILLKIPVFHPVYHP